jgi:hypothetical protein
MLHFNFKKSSRKCYVSEREFEPGQEFFSALFERDDGSTERRDFSGGHWAGPPEDCIGWWKSSIPELGKGRVYWAPKNVMLSYFEHVQSSPQTVDIAFVTGLLLAQKKILTIVDAGDDENLVLNCRSSKKTYTVPVIDVTPQRLGEIQAELSERLFMDQPVADDYAGDESKGDSEPASE